VNFANWVLKLPSGAIEYIICSDEAYFYLTLPINKQNNRMWLKSQPDVGVEQPLQDQKFLVWCAISAKKVFGSHFFDTSVTQHN
jgi:hypothetical protein